MVYANLLGMTGILVWFLIWGQFTSNIGIILVFDMLCGKSFIVIFYYSEFWSVYVRLFFPGSIVILDSCVGIISIILLV